MDAIQKTLIKSGRKDLAQKYYKIVADSMYVPQGYYQTIKDFIIDPGGAWKMRFSRDKILRSDGKGILEVWSSIDNKWVKRKPPISGKDTFSFNYGDDPQGLKNSFFKWTKKVNEKQAFDLIQQSLKEMVIPVKDVIKTIKSLKLKPNDKVKITVVKG